MEIRVILLRCVACALFIVCTWATSAAAIAEVKQQQNVVYAEEYGVALVMDVFEPVGEKNGLAVVDVVSGAWSSSRAKLRDHQLAQVFETLCGRGYTVFAVRPGSISKFSIQEMVSHIEQAIRWVKQHADEYGIAADRIGLMGASAGGHLASLVAVTNGRSEVHPGMDSASVKAVAVFFPPTDLVEFGEQSTSEVSEIARRVAVAGDDGELSEQEIRKRLEAISPARNVTKDAPPFLLIHGTADNVVPIEQSHKMVRALQAQGVSADLIVKEGGGHPWLTLPVEVAKLADWLDRTL